uniref:Uncharacterized protein n=1 Tax=viral metagenome TaxID=1070528 RepID=A0A6M3JK53_9ZZZZ
MAKEEQPKVSEKSLPQGFKLHYYTILDKKMSPRATVCLVVYKGVAARGIALCATKEFLEEGFKDEKGREMARRRLMKAWNRKENIIETISPDGWKTIATIPLSNVGVNSYHNLNKFFEYKGAYDVKLTAIEKGLMGN